jgi:ribokinase
MKQPRDAILVAGSANIDFVVRAAHVPAAGETVLGRDLGVYPGGKGANQAVACARAGRVETRMLLAVGDDTFAPLVEESLRQAGVRIHLVRVPAAATGVALICLADDAQNAITVAPGANAALRGSDLPSLEGVGYLLLQLETPLDTVLAFARAAHANGVKVLLNAAPAQALPQELLALVDVLIVNEDELTRVAKSASATFRRSTAQRKSRLSQAVTRHGAIGEVLASLEVPCAVVTLGSRGCCARQDGAFHLQPAFKIDAIDTTAAGDTFCGALASALCSASPLPDALRRASAAAALATTRVGAQSSIPTGEEVDALLRSHDDTRHGARDDLAAYCGLKS